MSLFQAECSWSLGHSLETQHDGFFVGSLWHWEVLGVAGTEEKGADSVDLSLCRVCVAQVDGSKGPDSSA